MGTKKILFILMFLMFSQYINANKWICSKQDIPNEILSLKYISSNLVYTTTTLQTIDKYVKFFMEKPDQTLLDYTNSLNIHTLYDVVSKVQLPKEQLLIIQKYLLSTGVIKKTSSILDRLFWLINIRLIKREGELKTALKLRVLSNNETYIKDAMKMYIEYGMVEEIKYWSSQLQYENSKKQFKIFLKKAKIIKQLKENEPNTMKKLHHEIKMSIHNVYFNLLPITESDERYLEWLLTIFGVYNNNHNILEILNNLDKDMWFYNQKEQKQFLIDNPLYHNYRFVRNNKDLIVINGVKKALNPYQKVPLIKGFKPECSDIKKKIAQKSKKPSS